MAKLNYNSETTECVAIEFFAEPTDINGRTVNGYSYVNMDNFFIDGFNTVVKMTTNDAGWITSCKLNNFTANNFETLIETDQLSEDSQCIDANIFDTWEVQTQSMTRDIFRDMNSRNIYRNFKLWDMHTNPKSNLGYITGSFISQDFPSKKEQIFIASSLYGGRGYRYLGRFRTLNTNSAFAYFTIKGWNLDIDSEISVSARNGKPQVTRKHYGRIPMLNARLSFHIVELDDGQVDLYCKPSSEYDLSFYLRDYGLFTANSEGSLWYTELSNSTEIVNNEELYYSVKPVSKIKTAEQQTVHANTPTVVNINERVIDTRFSFDYNDTGKIYCVQKGIYQVIGKIQYNGASGGEGRISFRKNGVYLSGGESENVVGLKSPGSNVLNASAILELDVGDYVEMIARHTDTVSLNILGELSLFKISD